MPGESKKISELESASSLNNGDLLELASVNALSETGYSSKKTTISDIADKVATLNPQAQADWTEADNTDPSYIQNKPTLATVATSGSYNDLQDQPQIPDAQVNSDWNSSSGVSEILNKPTLGTAASKNTGVANGVAELDANGLVPTSQLPSFVDDVLEYASQSAFPATGETGKIYVALDTNLTYRWSGSAYVEISPSLALGETSSTAYAGNKGKANADAISAIQTTLSGLATVATTGDYEDLTNKPNIPTVNNATVTFTQGGTTKGSITLNQAADATIALDAGGGGGGGHTILDDSGTSLTQRSELQFKGAYSVDDSTNQKTVVNVVRSMTRAEFDLLTIDEKTGIINITDESGSSSATQIDTLYSGIAVASDVVALSAPYTDYEILIFKCYNTNMGGYYGSSWNVSTLNVNDELLVGHGYAGQDRRLIGKFSATDAFTVLTSENGTQLKEIIGYKFGGGGSNSVELTYAEYQALTPEQQLDGTEYFITDINGDGQDFQPIIYSEEEREIGVWTDGKPLYENTVPTGAFILNSSTTTYSIAIDNDIDTIADIRGVIIEAGISYNLPDCNVRISFNPPNLVVTRMGGSWSISEGYITIQYTKTTDQAGSGTWTPQGVPAVHYSTTEHVVGTWIDGKTLYEESAEIPANTPLTDYTVFTIPNLGDVVEMNLVSNQTNGVWENNSFERSGNSLILNFEPPEDAPNQSVSFSGKTYVTIRYTKSST